MDLDRYFDSNAYVDSDSLLTTEPPDVIDSPTVGGAAMDTAGVTEAGGGMVKFDHSFQLSMFVLLLSAGLVLWIIRHIIRSRGQNSCGYKAKKRPVLRQSRGHRGENGSKISAGETIQDRIIQLKVLKILERTSNVNTSLSKIPTTHNTKMT